MEEIWKDIPGFEGFYEVSNLGSVRRKGGYRTNVMVQHLFIKQRK